MKGDDLQFNSENARQQLLPMVEFSQAVDCFAESSVEERGAVFTRREVVEFILDLVGYTTDQPLQGFRLLEPSFGYGDFLIPVADRLLTSYDACQPNRTRIVRDLSDAIRAVEVHRQSSAKTRVKLLQLLGERGFSREVASELIDAWIIEDDFLLTELPHGFTHAVGNPPYVRQELIPDALMAEYRARYRTIYDRADLYIPFIERCLSSLELGGVLGFICADRWMKNKYGGPLRGMVASQYRLSCYVDMVDTAAFDADVIAYPAITIIRREQPGPTRIAHRPRIERNTLADLAKAMLRGGPPTNGAVIEVDGVVKGREPWILRSFEQLAVVRRLESQYPAIEESGCKVGIGVATGADKVFIGKFDSLDVEPDRKLPLVRTRDIEKGTVDWQGFGVINPFRDDGSLVDLAKYPMLDAYFGRHRGTIQKRNCAKNNPRGWYRTIDRIYPELTHRPKLLIPDIKGEAHVVYEHGQLYPHHNLYFITSDEWDLRALQAVLRSGIAKLFVSVYSTQMRGGFLRYQAQYLRRIRLPRWQEVTGQIRDALLEASVGENSEACNRATFDLYQLSAAEREAIRTNGK